MKSAQELNHEPEEVEQQDKTVLKWRSVSTERMVVAGAAPPREEVVVEEWLGVEGGGTLLFTFPSKQLFSFRRYC